MLRSKVRQVRSFVSASILAAMLAATVPARGEVKDFPPGAFSDGQKYSLEDMQGKVVVLFFYDQDCPKCRGLIPDRNKVVDQFAGKPVKFFAVAAGDTLSDAKSYIMGTKLKMTTFSDLFGVMQARYGTGTISLQNIYQFRVIGPKGNVVANSMEPADIERALAGGAMWKFKDAGYDPRLMPIIDALEWGQYVPAVRELKKYTKGGNKATQESAVKLWDTLKSEAKGWMEEAAKGIETDPVKAYDTYTKVSGAYIGDDLGKEADTALKTLAKNKAVNDELAARKMFDGLSVASARAQVTQKGAFIEQARAIGKKYPESPTGKKAEALASEMESSK